MSKNTSTLIGVVLLFAGLSNLTQPNYGFSDIGGSEGGGYNAMIFLIYILGPVFLYKGIKK
ncbi:MAG: hypothetical protein ACTSUT_16165 [Promethearchaeota archaeon]